MEKTNTIKEWLNEYRNPRTARINLHRLEKFLEWSGKTSTELSKMTSKQAKHEILKFQSDMVEQDMSKNSILAYISAIKTFLEFSGKAVSFRRGQLVQPQRAEGYHFFSNGDLKALFDIANTEYKALISTLASTGWSLSDVLRLDKQHVEQLIQRARANNQEYIFEESTRQKTNARSLLVLNPLSIEWLEKWLQQNEAQALFSIRKRAVDKMLKKLAKRSGIKTTGKIRIHNIRKWTLNSLIKAGFSTYEAKYICGKKIPLSDDTYLNLKDGIALKFPEKYEKYLSIVRFQQTNQTQKVTDLESVIQDQQMEIRKLNLRIDALTKGLERLKEDWSEIAKRPAKEEIRKRPPKLD